MFATHVFAPRAVPTARIVLPLLRSLRLKLNTSRLDIIPCYAFLPAYIYTPELRTLILSIKVSDMATFRLVPWDSLAKLPQRFPRLSQVIIRTKMTESAAYGGIVPNGTTWLAKPAPKAEIEDIVGAAFKHTARDMAIMFEYAT